MVTDKAIVKKHLDSWKAAIIREYNIKLKASGSFGKSINVVETSSGGLIEGNAYVGAMVFGRRPTSAGSKRGGISLQKMIYQWIDDKGISYKSEKDHLSMSWAIAANIHKNGIKVPNKHNDGKFLDRAIPEKSKMDLAKEINKSYTVAFSTNIKNTWLTLK